MSALVAATAITQQHGLLINDALLVAVMQQHGLTHGLHTLDALQLAVALDLRARGMLDQFVTADRVLLVVAALEGLAVFDPEHP